MVNRLASVVLDIVIVIFIVDRRAVFLGTFIWTVLGHFRRDRLLLIVADSVCKSLIGGLYGFYVGL